MLKKLQNRLDARKSQLDCGEVYLHHASPSNKSSMALAFFRIFFGGFGNDARPLMVGEHVPEGPLYRVFPLPSLQPSSSDATEG